MVKETILYCPLNWGLGHATRIVPLIKQSIDDKHKVIIAAEGAPLEFLKQEFPGIQYVSFSGFKIRYWARPFFNLGLFLQLPIFYLSFYYERVKVKRLTKRLNITKIISDNRYGVFSKKTQSIIITHQLFIKVPKPFKRVESLIHKLTKALICRFDECWVPDYKEMEKCLSGELSHGRPIPENVKYIGPLSRFAKYKPLSETKPKNIPDVLILISGPEPARTYFEKEMKKRFKGTNQQVLMVRGKPMEYSKVSDGYIWKISHLTTNEMYWYLKYCKLIVSRSGYSTLMDLHFFDREAELSPTPGQPEQEYLYEHYKKRLFGKPKSL